MPPNTQQLENRIAQLEGVLGQLLKSDRMVLTRTLQFFDGRNIQLGLTTGTKFGTETSQLIGFWNTTPVNQPDAVATPTTQNIAGSDTVDENKIEADLTSLKTAVDGILTALRETGLINT